MCGGNDSDSSSGEFLTKRYEILAVQRFIPAIACLQDVTIYKASIPDAGHSLLGPSFDIRTSRNDRQLAMVEDALRRARSRGAHGNHSVVVITA